MELDRVIGRLSGLSFGFLGGGLLHSLLKLGITVSPIELIGGGFNEIDKWCN